MNEKEQEQFLKSVDEISKFFDSRPLMKEDPNKIAIIPFFLRLDLLDNGEVVFTGPHCIEKALAFEKLIPDIKIVVIDETPTRRVIKCIDWDARLERARTRVHRNIKNFLFPLEKAKLLKDYKSHLKMWTDTGYFPFMIDENEFKEYHRPPETDEHWVARMGLKLDMKVKFNPGPPLA